MHGNGRDLIMILSPSKLNMFIICRSINAGLGSASFLLPRLFYDLWGIFSTLILQ